MEVAVVAVGRLKAGPERDLCARYLERARAVGRGLGLRGFAVTEIAEARGGRAAERVAAEADALRGLVGKGGRTYCLDERGELLDSAEFAARLGRDAAAAGGRTTFVIGGPDGLGPEILATANGLISFGRLTWPHQIVRILLAEQLYRATTILSGHPYHRA
jgi:23S rRNA (pseudouridine1915-N3)-methyltransferase